MLPAVRFYTYAKRFEEAYTTVMRPLTVELKMAQPAVDILLFLANNPGMGHRAGYLHYRHLKPSIVSFHVDNLVQQGYLERQDIPEDRRKCPSGLHGQGRAGHPGGDGLYRRPFPGS